MGDPLHEQAGSTPAALAADWAERHGVDATSSGLYGLPRMPVLAGGLVHPSARRSRRAPRT